MGATTGTTTTSNDTVVFSTTVDVRYADIDPTGCVPGSKYLQFAIDARFEFLRSQGFDMARLTGLGITPTTFREDLEYRREVGQGDQVEVTVELAGLNADGSRWRLHQDIIGPGGMPAARVRSSGAWLDLVTRELVIPPTSIVAAFRGLRGTEDF